MVKIGVTGIAGRMGSFVGLLVTQAEDMELTGALEAEAQRSIGTDAGLIVGAGTLGTKITDHMEEAFRDVRVIIDFTMPELTMKLARYAQGANKALVIGTTGLSDADVALLKSISSTVPIVQSPNMSIGVNVMFKAVSMLTKLLGDAYDVEIVEAHHRLKKDAPSGTALGIARAIADARGIDLNDHACYERHGLIGQRPQGQIGIQTLRGGDIIGDHTVLFAGNSERIEITHRAHTRQNFAQGAVRAARWVAERKSGLYTMMDVLGLT
jgi:4-hydroxy-tetrahydrodipicolinate reductase